MTTQVTDTGTVATGDVTTPAPDATTLKDGDFDPTKWLQERTPEEQRLIEEYVGFRKKPLESEVHGLRT